MIEQHTVVCTLEVKPGKEADMQAALQHVAEQSRLEDANIEYRVHQNVQNPCEFVVYENWTSAEKHQEQFQKNYILEFAAKLEDLAEKPFTAYFCKEI